MKLIKTLFIFSAGLLLLTGAIAYFQLPASEETLLILHFRPEAGIDLYGSIQDVYNLILFGFGLVAVNLFLSRVFARRERFFSLLFAGTTTFLSLLILIAVFVIVLNNKEPSALFIL